jgi:hypothetical protein
MGDREGGRGVTRERNKGEENMRATSPPPPPTLHREAALHLGWSRAAGSTRESAERREPKKREDREIPKDKVESLEIRLKNFAENSLNNNEIQYKNSCLGKLAEKPNNDFLLKIQSLYTLQFLPLRHTRCCNFDLYQFC